MSFPDTLDSAVGGLGLYCFDAVPAIMPTVGQQALVCVRSEIADELVGCLCEQGLVPTTTIALFAGVHALDSGVRLALLCSKGDFCPALRITPQVYFHLASEPVPLSPMIDALSVSSCVVHPP